MQLEINPPMKIAVVFNGTEYTMHKPKLGKVRDFEDALEAAKKSGGSVNGLVISFVASCGLPAEVIDELDSDQLEQVVGVLSAAKKK